MGPNAHRSLIVPDVLPGDGFQVDGENVEIKGLEDPLPQNSGLWIPALKTVVAGMVVTGDNTLAWRADAQTAAARTSAPFFTGHQQASRGSVASGNIEIFVRLHR